MSKNIGWKKREAKMIAEPLNTSVSLAYIVREEHFRSKPPTHEYIVEVRKKEPKHEEE